MNQAIFEILRTGTHEGGNGTFTFNSEDLAGIANFYDEKVSLAPIVIGHPEDDKPERGKVTALHHYNNHLFATVELDDALVQSIKNGEISGISSAVYFSDSEFNPVKGLGCYLKHVGFLEKGKDEPAVKGMLPPTASVLLANLNDGGNICFLNAGQYNGNSGLVELDQKANYLKNALNVEYGVALDILAKK